jgi:hypothetical protein
MKLLSFFVCASLLISVAASAAEPVLKCTINKGRYVDQKLIKAWDSSTDGNPSGEFKYYGQYTDQTPTSTSYVYILWGVNVGAGASPNSNNRFQILAYYANPGTPSVDVFSDVDASKPIDLAVYVPIADVTVRCAGN